jgi:methyl-accepting chemotaxis protein
LALISAIILLVPSILIGWLSFTKSRSQITDLLMNSAAVNVNLVNTYISDIVKGKEDDTDTLARTVEQEFKRDSAHPRLADILQQFTANNPGSGLPFVGMNDGTMIIGSTQQKTPQGYDPRETPWFKDAVGQSGQLVITNPYQDAVSGEFVVTVAKAVNGGAGVVGINVTLSELKKLTKDVHIGEQGYIVIYSKNKQFFLHPTTKPGTPTQPHNEVMYKNDHGNYEYLFNGQPKKMIYTTNPETGWKVAGNMSNTEITNMVTPILDRTMIVIAVAVVLGGALMVLLIMSIVKPLNRLMKGSERMSRGDLTQRIQVGSMDELGRVTASFNHMGDSLSSVIRELANNAKELATASGELKASSEQTNKATEQIVGTIQELASDSEQQSLYMEESTRATIEMSSGVQQIASSSSTVAQTSMRTTEKAADGYSAIQSVIDQMNSIHGAVRHLSVTVKELGEQSRQINQITDMISEISSQTNLLSLNAAIEAARAGEHGRGFAVVASEVRKLADQSVQSTQQITEVISNIQAETQKAIDSMEETVQAVEDGIGKANQAGESFEHIRESVQEVVGQIREVAAATDVISGSTDQVTQTIRFITDVAQRTASATQELSASSEEQLATIEEITASSAKLHEMSEKLRNVVEQFKVD